MGNSGCGSGVPLEIFGGVLLDLEGVYILRSNPAALAWCGMI